MAGDFRLGRVLRQSSICLPSALVEFVVYETYVTIYLIAIVLHMIACVERTLRPLRRQPHNNRSLTAAIDDAVWCDGDAEVANLRTA
jgi:hypothetical protein